MEKLGPYAQPLLWGALGLLIGCGVALPTARLVRVFHHQLDDSVPYATWEGRLAAALCPALLLAVGLRYGSLNGQAFLPALLTALSVWVSCIVLVLDWRLRYIPDRVQYPAIVMALLLRWAIQANPTEALLGMALGVAFWGTIYLVATVAYKNPEAFGRGDVKLGAFIGAVLGPVYALIAFAMGITLGGIFAGAYIVMQRGSRKSFIAYGPFMVLGLLFVLYLFPKGVFHLPA